MSDVAPSPRGLAGRLLAIGAITGILLAAFFVGRHWSGILLAEYWGAKLETVPDDRADLLVASAARLGRPGIPVLVQALGSPRDAVASAGRIWLDRQLESWENVSNEHSQRNVAALAEALASQVESFDPAARLEAARLAARLLRWRLDPKVVNRARVTWLCDRVLRAGDKTSPQSDALAPRTASRPSAAPDETTSAEVFPAKILEPARLEFPMVAEDDFTPRRFAVSVAGQGAANVIPFPKVAGKPPAPDLAEAWAMRGHRLGEEEPPDSAVRLYPETQQRVLLPPAPETKPASDEAAQSLREMSLADCMRLLHDSGLTPLAAEEELKRRGLDEMRLSIARRVFHPDRSVRLQLVRDLPDMPGLDAIDWLLMMTGDEDAEVRLAAVSLLATAGDPELLARVESIARTDPDEKIRDQAKRLARRRRNLRR